MTSRSLLTGSPGSGMTFATCEERDIIYHICTECWVKQYHWLHLHRRGRVTHCLAVTAQQVNVQNRNSRNLTCISWSAWQSPLSHFTLKQEIIGSHCLHSNDPVTPNTAGWPWMRLYHYCNTVGYTARSQYYFIYLVALFTFWPNWSILSSFSLWRKHQNQYFRPHLHFNRGKCGLFLIGSRESSAVQCISKWHLGTSSSPRGCPRRLPSQIRHKVFLLLNDVISASRGHLPMHSCSYDTIQSILNQPHGTSLWNVSF